MKEGKLTKRIHTGLTLIEAAVVILLMMLVMVMGSVYWKNSTANLEYNSTAVQLNTVTSAGVNYIHDHYAELSNNVSAGHPVIITGQQLRDAGYLMPGYSLTNNSHQDYQVAVAINPKFSDRLVAFVLTQNGTEIPYDGLRTITGYAGGMSGYIHDDNIAEGAYGSWKAILTDYGLSAKKGHLASYMASDKLGASADAGDRLYRYSVDGHPVLNQMKTAIDMDLNNIDNVATVNAKDVAASNGITARSLMASDTVDTNILSATTVNTRGNVTAQGSMTAQGNMTGNAVRANGRLSAGEVLQLDQINTAGAACSLNGLVSRDSNGGLLTCLSLVWTSPGNGWKQPAPQTIQCVIQWSQSGYDYTHTFQAKIDTEGSYWARSITDNGTDSGWIRGMYSKPEGSGITSAIVTISGLQAQKPGSQCSAVGGGGQNCEDVVRYCMVPWTF